MEQGEGTHNNTKPVKETLAEHEEPDTNANLTAGNSEEGEARMRLSISQSHSDA
jgi:hypothetical protein